MEIDVAFRHERPILCWAHTRMGDYGKLFLVISDNSSGTDYFKAISSEFDRKVEETGLRSLMVDWYTTSRIYRLPDNGWWNAKENRWYERGEWIATVNKLLGEINEDFKAGKFDQN